MAQEFVDGRTLPDPFDGHHCQFVAEGVSFGTTTVPPHGHPFASRKPPGPWGMTSPFGDMLDADVGTALGNLIALRFLAGTLPAVSMPNPEALRYGLA